MRGMTLREYLLIGAWISLAVPSLFLPLNYIFLVFLAGFVLFVIEERERMLYGLRRARLVLANALGEVAGNRILFAAHLRNVLRRRSWIGGSIARAAHDAADCLRGQAA